MRAGKDSIRLASQQRFARTLAVLAVLGLLFGLAGMGEIAEDSLRVARNRLTPANASGQVVLIGIDDKSQKRFGNWPWRRTIQADLIDRLDAAGAKRIFLDVAYDYPTTQKDDSVLYRSIQRSGKIVMPVATRRDFRHGQAVAGEKSPSFKDIATVGSISAPYNYQGALWRMPYAVEVKGQAYRSFASLMGGAQGPVGSMFPVDYRYRFDSIPYVSASDVLEGRFDPAKLRGRQVIVGTNSSAIGDQFTVPGLGRTGGVYTHVYGAETLLAGRPVDLGWLPGLIAGLALAAAAMRGRRKRIQAAALGAGIALLLTVPVATEPLHWFLDITPGLFVLIVAGGILIRRRYRASGFTNAATGLSNFNALRTNRDTGDRALIVARVLNYPQISANLPQADEPKLVEQIVSRLSIGTVRSNVYQGDEGIFAWLAEPGIAIGHHVEALHALFRNPAKVGKTAYDIAISFGVEIGSGRNIANRLSSALVAADEAAAEGLKWKYHDPERFKDEQWRLSLLAQLDQAIGRGEVWVAYQPQLDLATGRIRGAEALARWTHPEKGPISPHEFITAAEQHGRIDGLTMFMLEQAIVACAKLNRSGEPFHISVNLSARTLARRALPGEVRDLLARHRVDPKLLTLELTETAALASDGSDLDPLVRLRDLGVRISIDDYGTGLSTLEYLKKIPATEIKIDQGFIKSMNDNRSDLVMVKSTIALAHSLGRTVVAEGVESRETLDSLIAMKCDAAQGFVIGRPVSFDGLVRRLTSQSRVRAA